jgi:lactoylglutathione lyase
LGLQQIAVGALDKGPLSKIWGDVFGLKKVHSFKSEQENVDEDIMQLGEGPYAVEVDLMTPLDPEKVSSQKLAVVIRTPVRASLMTSYRNL